MINTLDLISLSALIVALYLHPVHFLAIVSVIKLIINTVYVSELGIAFYKNIQHHSTQVSYRVQVLLTPYFF